MRDSAGAVILPLLAGALRGAEGCRREAGGSSRLVRRPAVSFSSAVPVCVPRESIFLSPYLVKVRSET